MRVFIVHVLEDFVADKSNHDGKHKEQNCVDEHCRRLGLRIFKSDYKGKYDNTDDVVNDCRTQDGSSDLAF